MRMKKLLILAAVAAIAATACTKTFEAKPTAETPIGFGSWAIRWSTVTAMARFSRPSGLKVRREVP